MPYIFLDHRSFSHTYSLKGDHPFRRMIQTCDPKNCAILLKNIKPKFSKSPGQPLFSGLSRGISIRNNFHLAQIQGIRSLPCHVIYPRETYTSAGINSAKIANWKFLLVVKMVKSEL
eukprot:Sdes_comp20187_c1_seq1m13460